MTEKEKIFKLIDYIKDKPYTDFIELIEHANCNNLMNVLKKYDKLFIYSHYDSLIEKDTSELEKKWDEWENKLLEIEEKK